MLELWYSVNCQLPLKSTANETEMFKKTLKRSLMDNSFYSMDDFF